LTGRTKTEKESAGDDYLSMLEGVAERREELNCEI
jgi:hypothetical protein